MREIDRAIAEEAILKKAQEIHKERVDTLKAQAVHDGVLMRSPEMFSAKVGGVDLIDGKPSVPFSKFNMHDREAALDWLDEIDSMEAYTYGFARDNIAEFAEWYLERTGECAEGCTLINGMTEEVPMGAKFLIRNSKKVDEVIDTLKKNPHAVATVLLGLLGGELSGLFSPVDESSTPLLEGGE